MLTQIRKKKETNRTYKTYGRHVHVRVVFSTFYHVNPRLKNADPFGIDQQGLVNNNFPMLR